MTVTFHATDGNITLRTTSDGATYQHVEHDGQTWVAPIGTRPTDPGWTLTTLDHPRPDIKRVATDLRVTPEQRDEMDRSAATAAAARPLTEHLIDAALGIPTHIPASAIAQRRGVNAQRWGAH